MILLAPWCEVHHRAVTIERKGIMATVLEPRIEPRRMTLAEFRLLPDDPSVDRELVLGKLREEPMTRRNRWHARLEARLARLLGQWIGAGNVCHYEVFSGEVGCELEATNSSFGIDVAVFSAEVMARQPVDAPYIIGPPVLAVEVLSPSDTQQDIHDKVGSYLQGGTGCVWIVDPSDQTVRSYRPGDRPRLFAEGDVLDAGDCLPGLQIPIADLFANKLRTEP